MLYILIDLQILLNNVQRNVWHAERRITSQILGVKRLLAVIILKRLERY